MYKLTNYNGQTYFQLPDGSFVFHGKLFLTLKGIPGSLQFIFSNEQGPLYTIAQNEISDYYGNLGAPFLAMAARTVMEVFMDANMVA